MCEETGVLRRGTPRTSFSILNPKLKECFNNITIWNEFKQFGLNSESQTKFCTNIGHASRDRRFT